MGMYFKNKKAQVTTSDSYMKYNQIFFYLLFFIVLLAYDECVLYFQHFNYPLSLTMAHLVTKFMLAALIRTIIEWKTGEPRVTLPWGMFCKRIAPAGM
jgi:solute carrier family 35 protein C2